MDEESDDVEQRDDDQADDIVDTPDFCRSVLERDRIYEALAHERRRYLCYLLCDRSELQVDDAVSAIADWESDDGAAADDGNREASGGDANDADDGATGQSPDQQVNDAFGIDSSDDGFEPLSVLDPISKPIQNPQQQAFDGVFSLLSVGAIGVLVSRRFR